MKIIWITDLMKCCDADSIRYFLISNGAEKRDADFSWQAYTSCHNHELLGAYGNFINRTLTFIIKYLDGIVPEGTLDEEIGGKLDTIYETVGNMIEKGQLRDALDEIFAFVRSANKYFDACRPWITRNTDLPQCNYTLYNCIQLIANLAILLEPFLPFSSEKVRGWLQLDNSWSKKNIQPGYRLPEIQILFQRLEECKEKQKGG